MVAEAKLVVLFVEDVLEWLPSEDSWFKSSSRDPLEVDVWRIAREADIVNSTEIPSDECPGQRF